MRRRKPLWIAIGVLVAVAAVALLWPRSKDELQFLYDLGPAEVSETSFALRPGEGRDHLVLVFRGSKAATVIRSMRRYWVVDRHFTETSFRAATVFRSDDSECTAGYWQYAGKLLGPDYPTPQIGDLVVEVFRPETWLEGLMHGIKRFLRLE